MLERLARRTEDESFAVQENGAGVRSEHARDDPAERRLAGAVFPDERVDRPAPDLERYLVERPDAAEVLGDAQELEVGSLRLAYFHYAVGVTPATQP